MNSKLRYLALALLITTGLNATPVKTEVQEDTGSSFWIGVSTAKDNLVDYSKTFLNSEDEDATETENKESDVPVEEGQNSTETENKDSDISVEEEQDSNDGVVASIKAIPAAVKALAHNGVAGVESFVVEHPKSVAGIAVVATVATVYSVVKWRAAAHKAATLKEQLEEVNAITA